MTETPAKIKLYPSSSAFMLGGQVKTSKHTSCFRFLQAQHFSGLTKEQLHSEIAPEYAALGALDEWQFAAAMDKKGIQYKREQPFRSEFGSAVVSGRMDFVLDDGTIVEKKSTTSQNVYRRVFEQGIPEPSHMAQLVTYMALNGQESGRLVVSYWELAPDYQGFRVVEEKQFDVKTVDKTRIMLGQQEYSHTVKDLARWYAEAEKNLSQDLTTGVLAQKPCQPVSKYESPCNFCPLNKICETGPDGMTLAYFTEAAKSALVLKPAPMGFKIMVNTERRQANREKKVESRKKVSKV